MKTGPMLFDWPGRHHIQVILPAALLLALLLHAAVFFAFSIVYPPTQAKGPDPVQVYFPLPGSPEAQRLAVLVPFQDPAIVAPGRGVFLGEVPAARYAPSYETARLPLAAAPSVEPRRAPVSPVSLRSVPVGAGAAAGKPAPRSFPTALAAGGDLAARLPEAWKGEFAAPANFVPRPARFLVGVREDGSVAHVLPAESSGNAGLDAEAVRALLATRFAPGRAAWDTVAIRWGSDVRPLDEP